MYLFWHLCSKGSLACLSCITKSVAYHQIYIYIYIYTEVQFPILFHFFRMVAQIIWVYYSYKVNWSLLSNINPSFTMLKVAIKQHYFTFATGSQGQWCNVSWWINCTLLNENIDLSDWICFFQSNVENLPPQVIRHVARELAELQKEPPEGVKVFPNEDDITDIQAAIDGPCK